VPLNPEHPWVTLTAPATGQTLQLIFTLHGKQIKRTTETKDYEKAQTYAKKLSDILVGKLFDDPPAETPDIVLKMLSAPFRKCGNTAGLKMQFSSHRFSSIHSI
jgi:hypothetical protein